MRNVDPCRHDVEPIIRQAITALDLLNVDTREKAAVLLSIWHRRDELSDDGLELVLHYYADDADQVGELESGPVGDWHYDRDETDDGSAELALGIVGWSLGSRAVPRQRSGGRY